MNDCICRTCMEHDSENARLRALLDERTALLRECLTHVSLYPAKCVCKPNDQCLAHTIDPRFSAKGITDRLIAEIETTLKETTCDS